MIRPLVIWSSDPAVLLWIQTPPRMKLFLPVLFFLFQQMTEVNSSETIAAAVGEDVVLKCKGDRPVDEQSLILVWERNGETVHKFRDYNDNLDLQDENFKNRTSLFLDKLKDGNFSLNLKNVTRNDGGNYTCSTDNTTVAVIDLTFSGKGEPKQEEGDQDKTRNIIIIIIIAAVLIWSKRKQHGRGVAEPQYQTVQGDDPEVRVDRPAGDVPLTSFQTTGGDDQNREVPEVRVDRPAGGAEKNDRALPNSAGVAGGTRRRTHTRSSSESSIQKSIRQLKSGSQKTSKSL
ncbi:uncharacterized protein LOC115058571 isoform X2 [Echeneis naucrates]|uniref:uncharacterized protein LOC115058571 isoform X2 n=1 Tax=Echeneis naucrates TaxID=173247 RepID=UPI001114045B|nr:uncharacterized protein LOC115058571 isoform X2 [Echeneis naucrates]